MKSMLIQTVIETEIDLEGSEIDVNCTDRVLIIKKQSKTTFVPFENICKLEVID